MALSIGAEGTRKSSENGWLSSRIKKIALATANEPKASATSWLEDADIAQAAQAARAELEAETEASHWSKLARSPSLEGEAGGLPGRNSHFPGKDRGLGGLQAPAIGNN